MLPLIAAAGVIGAIVSVAKGASWVSDQVDSSKGAASVGGKAGPTPLSETQASSFAAKLAAQNAGQPMPMSSAGVSAPTAGPATSATDYDMLARLKAGTIAYSHIGERHGSHAGAVNQPPEGGTTTAAQS